MTQRSDFVEKIARDLQAQKDSDPAKWHESFPEADAIVDELDKYAECQQIPSGLLCRLCRNRLGWSVDDLARKASLNDRMVSVDVIHDVESMDPVRKQKLSHDDLVGISTAFALAGLIVIDGEIFLGEPKLQRMPAELADFLQRRTKDTPQL